MHLQSRPSSLSQEIERLKCILQTCIGVLKHERYHPSPTVLGSCTMMFTVLSKRWVLPVEKKLHLARTIADRLHRADFLTHYPHKIGPACGALSMARAGGCR